MLRQHCCTTGSEVDHFTSIRQRAWYESAPIGFFPNRKTFTGCGPRFHYFFLRSVPSVQPLQQVKDEQFHRLILNCAGGHVHPAMLIFLRDSIAFAIRSASLPTPTTVAELMAYR